MNELLSLPAVELARRIREREVSPVQVVDAHIRRIEEVNPRLNAMVVPTFEAAREQARGAEQQLSQRRGEPLPPLFGVPFTVKELIAVEGQLKDVLGAQSGANATSRRDQARIRELEGQVAQLRRDVATANANTRNVNSQWTTAVRQFQDCQRQLNAANLRLRSCNTIQ